MRRRAMSFGCLATVIVLFLPASIGRAGEPVPGYAVWTANSMQRIMPQDQPPTASGDDRQRTPRASIALAGREYESFQVALRPPQGTELRGVRIKIGNLTCAAQGSEIAAANIQWHQVGYVHLKKVRPQPADPKAAPGWWPDPLLPVEEFHVAPEFTQAIWVTVYAPPGTPAGKYTGELTVCPQGLPTTAVHVSAKVYGFQLPVEGHLKTAFALMDGYLEQVYGKPRSAQLRRKFADMMLAHRLNPDDISRTDPPVIDDLLYYQDRGMNAFNVLNLVTERGSEPRMVYSPLSVYTPRFKQHLIAQLDPYVKELRRHGLANRAYIHGFDEREKEYYGVIKEYFGMVHQRYPGIPTLTTARVPLDPEELRRLNIDWICPLTPQYDFAKAERCRATGLQVWAYVCLGPEHPYANWLIPDPLIEARVIGWQAYQQKMDGLLYWGMNIWDKAVNNNRPIDPARGPLIDWGVTTTQAEAEYDWLHGDGVLMYPGPNGPIGSIRLANIRDGLEDYEYLWLLSRQSGNTETGRRACQPVTRSLTDFTPNPQVLAVQRNAVARRIEVTVRKD